MKKYLKVLIAGLMIGAVITGCGAKEKKDYVAIVNKQKITESEYKYFLAAAKNNIEQMSNVQSDEDKKSLWEGKLGEKSAVDYVKELALENAKEFKILFAKATEAGIKVDEKELESTNTQFDDYVKTLGEGDTGIKAYESMYGVSVEIVRAMNKDFNIVQQYYNEELKNTKVTDEELKKYYDENLTNYQQVTVKHVLFMTIDQTTGAALPQDKQDAAKKKAEDVLAKVKAGQDIAAIAKEQSEDGGSKENGGEYTFGKGKMVKEFEDWSFSAKVGDVGLVKTEYGYHVIRLEKVLTLEDVKDSVESDLILKKYSDQMEQWKNDPKNAMEKNDEIYNSIKVI